MKQGFKGCKDSLIFVIGGSTLTEDGDEFPASSFVQVFNVATGQTLIATPLPVPAPDVKAVSVDRRIHVITGKSLFVMEEVDEDEEADAALLEEEPRLDAEAANNNGVASVIEVAANNGEAVIRGATDINEVADIYGLADANGATNVTVAAAEVDDDDDDQPDTTPNTAVIAQENYPAGQSVSPHIDVAVGQSNGPKLKVRWTKLPSIPSMTGASSHMTTASSHLNHIYLFGGQLLLLILMWLLFLMWLLVFMMWLLLSILLGCCCRF